MQRSLLWLGVSSFLAAGAWAGCSSGGTDLFASTSTSASSSGSASASGAGGASTGGGADGTAGSSSVSGSSIASSSAGMGGGGPCVNDKYCDVGSKESCSCVDCINTAYCIPDKCVNDNECHPLDDDSCICNDCDGHQYCSDAAMENCSNDGVCDAVNEGCKCPDCATKPTCVDNIASCAGGKVNGACAAAEPCSCPDCFGLPKCVQSNCYIDGQCSDAEPCSCVDCKAADRCAAPKSCLADGICDILDEGCACDDCAPDPECK